MRRLARTPSGGVPAGDDADEGSRGRRTSSRIFGRTSLDGAAAPALDGDV
jgi:hypothetical protein